jgi:hypothetical protein
MEVQTLKTNPDVERLVKASGDGYVSVVHALLERGHVDVNGFDGVRLLFCSALNYTMVLHDNGQDQSVLWIWKVLCGLFDSYTVIVSPKFSVWIDSTS